MVSIKGTLETFNLCELLQMLAFNQKEGTLVLDSEDGGRSLYLDKGDLSFLETDAHIKASMVRMARRDQLASESRLEEAQSRAVESGRSLHSVLEGMGLLDKETAQIWYREAAVEQLFAAQLTSVAGFEFVEGSALEPDGTESRPIRPGLPVESLLLDLARMLDHWNTIIEVVPSQDEIYEGTGIGVDLDGNEEIDEDLAEAVIPRIDGYRSLGEIAGTCHATVYSVMHIAATLFSDGGIRAVPVASLVGRAEDLLARGEASAAVPLLHRALERGDAPLEARLRLADAYEASGQLTEAAVALDTYAALSDDEDAPAVFDALCRALRLREGDLATAARVCDYYLRRRPWLQEYSSLAASALRDLIHGATTRGRPLEAAARLEEFIKTGDAPSEDRLLLADLYAGGGDTQRAAATLFTECQALLSADKRVPARQMLRRLLEYDAGHADAQRLLLEMDGVRRRTHHHARVVGIILSLLLVAGGAGVAWFGYRDSATVEVGDAEAQAVIVNAEAEQKVRGLVAAFLERINATRDAPGEDPTLGPDANSLRREVREIMASTVRAMAAFAQELEKYAAAGKNASHHSRHQMLVNRRTLVTGEVDALLNGIIKEAGAAFLVGEQAHAEGRFEESRRELRRSRNLAFEDTTTRNNAVAKLELVDEYFEIYAGIATDLKEATEARDFARAFQIGAAGLRLLLDSDLSQKLAFPLRITSTPPGAEVWLGSANTGARTPCEITYSPFQEKPVLTLRLPGRSTQNHRLPTYDAILRGAAPAADWKPSVHGTLDPGPRWRTDAATAQLTALWAVGTVPVTLGNRGRTLYSVDVDDGTLTTGTRLEAGVDSMRFGGRLADGTLWTVHGQRTLRVQPQAGTPWETQSVGRIEYAPIATDGLIILTDETGMVYAYNCLDGSARWRLELSFPPSQQAQPSSLGILLATTHGRVFRVDPELGEATALLPAARGSAYVLPLGDGAVVLGGGKGGCRRVSADGTVHTLGDASPDFGRRPYAGRAGVAWIEADGRVRYIGHKGEAPFDVTGLGRHAHRLGGGAGSLFATTDAGTLRAVDLITPDMAAFEVPIGGKSTSTPIRIGRAVFLLVDGELLAVEI